MKRASRCDGGNVVERAREACFFWGKVQVNNEKFIFAKYTNERKFIQNCFEDGFVMHRSEILMQII